MYTQRHISTNLSSRPLTSWHNSATSYVSTVEDYSCACVEDTGKSVTFPAWIRSNYPQASISAKKTKKKTDDTPLIEVGYFLENRCVRITQHGTTNQETLHWTCCSSIKTVAHPQKNLKQMIASALVSPWGDDRLCRTLEIYMELYRIKLYVLWWWFMISLHVIFMCERAL